MTVLKNGNAMSKLDCTCDGKWPWCPDCLMSLAIHMRREHPDTLSVGMLKRRIPKISGREAALLIAATKYIKIPNRVP